MEKDFWSYYNRITSELPNVKEYDTDEIFYLIDEKINNIKQVIFSKEDIGISYLMENIDKAKSSADHVYYLRKEKPGNPELAGLHGILQSFFDSMFMLMRRYKPDVLGEDGCKSFAEKYCSVQVCELIFQNQDELEESNETNSATGKPMPFPEIALIYHYNDDLITKEDCKEIAEMYKHTVNGKFGGISLYNDFIDYSKKFNRTGVPKDSPRIHEVIINHQNRLEKIIPYVKEEKRQRLLKEIEEFKENVKNLDDL